MRYIFGFIMLFILSVIFSYFQGFIDFLIDLGIFPDKYRNNANFDIMMIFVLYVVFIVAAHIIAGIAFLGLYFLDAKQNMSIKRAKKKSLKTYGKERCYFLFLDPNDPNPVVQFAKSQFIYQVVESFLYENEDDSYIVHIKMKNLSPEEYLKVYFKAASFYGYPDIPKKYGIYEDFKDEQLAPYSEKVGA